MWSKTDHFYWLKKEGNLNSNWELNTHDLSIWNVKTGKKLKFMEWSNRSNWNKHMDY